MKAILAFAAIICHSLVAQPAALGQTERSMSPEAPVPKPPDFEARVEVIFDMPDSIAKPFADCVLNELKSLDDVVVTEINPQYRITIMALPNKTRQENIGFTFSILITRPFDKNILRPLLLSKNISDNEKMLLLLLGTKYERIEKNSLLTTSPEEVGIICKNIVSGFEADLLAKDRLLWKSAWNLHGQVEDGSAPSAE